jgi:hypothetical protein
MGRGLQVTCWAAIGAICMYVLPEPALGSCDPTHTSLWACATAASMALVLFKEQR